MLIRFAKALKKMMGAHGSRFADRYHERVLATPSDVRNALKYVLQNHAHHVRGALVDPFSSGPWFADWPAKVPQPAWVPCSFPPTSPPASWLLSAGGDGPEASSEERNISGTNSDAARALGAASALIRTRPTEPASASSA